MEKLERVLAVGVLDVLRERAHVVIAPARRDALRDELEAIISPALGWLEPYLSASSADDPRRNEAGTTVGAGGSVGAGGRALEQGRAHELMNQLVAQLAEKLLESDHVDDIFASDNVIRRDAHRSLRQLLMGYVRGELDVERLDDEQAVLVPLLELGYLVSEVSRRLDLDMLRDALERAAATVGGRLVNLTRGRVGHFDLPGGAEAGRLALEESITHELVALIEAELVELPSVERVLELAACDSLTNELETALERALMCTRAQYDCAVQCVAVDAQTVIVTLTPLSAHSSEQADRVFAAFVSTLDEELASVARAASGPDSATIDKRAPDSPRPASSRRKKSAKEPPRSQPRGRRGAPRAQTSSTRQLREAAAKKKRAK